jgi:hypothetical protein
VLNLHASIKRFDAALADKLIVFCADEERAARLQSAGPFSLSPATPLACQIPSTSRARGSVALVLHFDYSVGTMVKRALMVEHGAWYLPHPRSAAWHARMRYLMVTAGLRLGIWLAHPEVVVELGGNVAGPRWRLPDATRNLRLRR